MSLSSYAKISRSLRRLGRRLSFGSDSRLELCDNAYTPIVTLAGIDAGWGVVDQEGDDGAWLLEVPEAFVTREHVAQVSTALIHAHGKQLRFRAERIPQQVLGEPKLQFALKPL